MTLMLTPSRGQRLEHAVGDAGLAAHADADDRDLGDVLVDVEPGVVDAAARPGSPRSPRRARGTSSTGQEKVMSVRPSAPMFCTIMSTLTPAAASGPNSAAAMPGAVGHADHRHLRLVARVGDAADDPAIP